ncbi:MAG: TRAP transporter small permease [Myxococcales bacterium]|nr:TRAP transporter small permease [Myxococcales bacterium]
MASDNPLVSDVPRYDDAFERVDGLASRIESGVMTFALLAMSMTAFLKIIYEAVIADRNFVDSFLLRWLHGTDSQPPAELLSQVKELYSPIVVIVVLLLIGIGASRTISGQIATSRGDAELPPWKAMDFGLGLAIAAGFVGLGWLVVAVSSQIMCAALYVIALLLFGRRAQRSGDLVPFAVTWVVLSIPIGVLISRIPTQYAWVNDLSKILIMYVGFMGASMASRDRKHIVLNFGRKLWPTGARRSIEALSLLIWLSFNLLLLVLAAHLMQLQISAESELSVLPIPEYHIVFPVVLSFVLMSIRVAADLVRCLTGAVPVASDAKGEEVAA